MVSGVLIVVVLVVALTLCLILLAGDSEAASPETTVVVVNENDPDSVELGEYYAGKRDIPLGNIVSINISGEEINRTQYQELEEQLLGELEALGLNETVDTLVLMYGVP